ELIEAVFGGAVQSGLVRDGVRAGHLTAAPEGQCDVRRGAVIRGARSSGSGRCRSTTSTSAATTTTTRGTVQEGVGVHLCAAFDEEVHAGKHAFVGTVASARDACTVVDSGRGH